MANGTLAWRNNADSATIDGGDWGSTLANIKDTDLSLKAISATDAQADTQIEFEFADGVSNQVWLVHDTNISRSATISLELSSVSNFSVIDYEVVLDNFYAAAFDTDELEFEDDNWFDGIHTESQLNRYKRSWIHVAPMPQSSLYHRIKIVDEENPDEEVRIGRVFIGPAWIFNHNYSYNGAQLLIESNSLVDKSFGGVPFFDRREQTRVQLFSLDWMDSDEAYAKAIEVLREQDITGEVLYIPDIDDTKNNIRTVVFGRLRQLNALEAYAYGLNRMSFEVEEII